MAETRTPGSDEAKAAGCWCARMDNSYGAGAYVHPDLGPQFWITEGCPLHAPGAPPPEPGNG